MTERRAGATRRTIALVTTGIVSLGTAAVVGWPAAVPVGSSTATTAGTNGTASTTTSQQIDAAQANLQRVRRDLARLTAREDELPRARLANLSSLIAKLPSVQLPQQSVQPTVTHVAAPVTHTTSGASGARP